MKPYVKPLRPTSPFKSDSAIGIFHRSCQLVLDLTVPNLTRISRTGKTSTTQTLKQVAVAKLGNLDSLRQDLRLSPSCSDDCTTLKNEPFLTLLSRTSNSYKLVKGT